MNKLLKYILIGIAIFSVGIASTKATYEGGRVGNLGLSSRQTYEVGKGNSNVIAMGDNLTFCMYSANFNSPCNFTATYNSESVSITNSHGQWIACINNVTISNSVGVSVTNNNSSSCNGIYLFFPTEQVVPKLTTMQCQTEYNLIPINEVTANYCKLNFDLIDPAECPIQPSGSGQVSRSSLFVNDTQYPGNGIIRVGIPDYIGRSITYNDNENLIDIEGYNADTEYIENVINQEKLTPTTEEFGKLLQTLVNFVPYLFIGLLIIYFVKVLNKVRR